MAMSSTDNFPRKFTRGPRLHKHRLPQGGSHLRLTEQWKLGRELGSRQSTETQSPWEKLPDRNRERRGNTEGADLWGGT
jgi:hypothetical protein